MKLGIFKVDSAGNIQGYKKMHTVTQDEKLGNVLIPQNDDDYQDLLKGAGLNVAYREMTQDELEVAGLDLRVYKILSKEKVDLVMSLNSQEQYRIIKVLNDNLSALLDSAGKQVEDDTQAAGTVSGFADNTEFTDEQKGLQNTLDDFTVGELKSYLDANDIEYSKSALKPELLKLAKDVK